MSSGQKSQTTGENPSGNRTLQGQCTGFHIQEHQARTILPRDQCQKHQIWCRAGKAGPCEEKVIGVGGEMREEESTAQENDGLIDGGKEDKELHARQS